MQAALDWLVSHVPVLQAPTGQPVLGEDGYPVLRWPQPSGQIAEASAGFVTEKFGAAIEQALNIGTDVLDAVRTTGFDEGWHDIWSRWRELGFI